MSRARQCAYPGCFRTERADIHGPKWSCRRCAEEEGHVHWRSYLSVDRYSPRITEHHAWRAPDLTSRYAIPFSVAKVLESSARLETYVDGAWRDIMKDELPPLDGITYD